MLYDIHIHLYATTRSLQGTSELNRILQKKIDHHTSKKNGKHMETTETPSVKHHNITTPTTCALQEEKVLVESPTGSSY